MCDSNAGSVLFTFLFAKVLRSPPLKSIHWSFGMCATTLEPDIGSQMTDASIPATNQVIYGAWEYLGGLVNHLNIPGQRRKGRKRRKRARFFETHLPLCLHGMTIVLVPSH